MHRCVRNFAGFLVALVIGVLSGTPAWSQDGPAQSTEPIATCRVMTIAPAPPASATADHCQRGPAGDWMVPTKVDREDPRVRVLIDTPAGPLVADLSILVDGRSFRMQRELWIDQVLAPTTTGDEDGNQATSRGVGGHPIDACRRLQEYARKADVAVGRDEARWLLAQWTPGPALLELQARFARERAQRAPVWAVLDVDTDRTLSSAEIRSSNQRLHRLDRDEDDWITDRELSPVSLKELWAGHPLLWRLHDQTDWDLLRRTVLEGPGRELVSLSGASQVLQKTLERTSTRNEPGGLSAAPFEMPPDLELFVQFATGTAQNPSLAVISVSEALRPHLEGIDSQGEVITLRLPGCDLEISAGQPAPPVAASTWKGQVALGAVVDGRPLLRRLVRDNDHRLSLSEIDRASGAVADCDRNGDGRVQLEEVPVAIRLAITLGPDVDRVLQHPGVSQIPQRVVVGDQPPAWFAGMDLNADGELSATEFLGTPVQFDQLDEDRNERISVLEAARQAASP